MKTENASELIKEVMQWHSDPASADYNQCDTAPCRWCENARRLLAEVESTKQTEGENGSLPVKNVLAINLSPAPRAYK